MADSIQRLGNWTKPKVESARVSEWARVKQVIVSSKDVPDPKEQEVRERMTGSRGDFTGSYLRCIFPVAEKAARDLFA